MKQTVWGGNDLVHLKDFVLSSYSGLVLLVLIEDQLKSSHCISAKEAVYVHQTHDLQVTICAIVVSRVNWKRTIL